MSINGFTVVESLRKIKILDAFKRREAEVEKGKGRHKKRCLEL